MHKQRCEFWPQFTWEVAEQRSSPHSKFLRLLSHKPTRRSRNLAVGQGEGRNLSGRPTCQAYNIYVIIHFSMCFFKKIEFGESKHLHSDPTATSCLYQGQSMQGEVFSQCGGGLAMGVSLQPNWFFPAHSLSPHLTTLISHIANHNEMLRIFSAKLDQNSQLLQIADQQLSLLLPASPTHPATASPTLSPAPTTPCPAAHPLTAKLFGQKGYKYKLKLAADFPKLIYKERNLNLGVKLVDCEGRSVSNGNLIHICMGACDEEGRWIVEQSGELFMQGKVEVDLYHGEADFRKIYPRDVTRHFKGGRINIVIYAKPSVLTFTGDASGKEEVVQYCEIEPLVLGERVVKAKKKSR